MKQVLRVALVLTLLLAAFTLRAVLGGEAELAKSTAALDRGDVRASIDHARTAALFYVPGAPHVRVAYGRLLAIGEEAERRREWDLALLAFRSVTTASSSTRWAVTPHATDALVAEDAVVRIEDKRRSATAAEPPPRPPSRAPSALRFALPAAFFGVIAGLVLVLRRGLDEAGRLQLKASAPGLVLAASGAVAYVVALVWV